MAVRKHTVVAGDTLWDLAKRYYGDATQYKRIAAIKQNNIKNPNLIYVGQVLYIDNPGKAPSTPSNKLRLLQFGRSSAPGQEKVLFASWDWSRLNDYSDKTTEGFKVLWTYDTGNGHWIGEPKTITIDYDLKAEDLAMYEYSTFNIPDNAIAIKFKVKPIAKNKKNSDTPEWPESSWSATKTYTNLMALTAPSGPLTVTIDKDNKLMASLNNVDIPNVIGIEFQVIRDNVQSGSGGYDMRRVPLSTGRAAYTRTVQSDHEYKVRCRSYGKGSYISDWTAYSENVYSTPSAPSGITSVKASSKTSVLLEWAEVKFATSYDVQYSQKQENFDINDQVPEKSGVENTSWEFTGLETGKEYFFRVRAARDSIKSGWTEIKSVVLGTKPAAPTTWSSTTTAIVGEPVNMYWVHNSADGSSQTRATLNVYVNDTLVVNQIIENTASEEDKDKTSVYTFDTASYSEGATIKWKVRTAGVTNEYGDWSIDRTIDVYARPSLELSVLGVDNNDLDVITEFPLTIKALGHPNTQLPIGYHLSVTSKSDYETTDSLGNIKMVKAGDQVYSNYFDVTGMLETVLSANDIDLENGVEYVFSCIASMNSGLTAEDTKTLSVAWEDRTCEPNAEVVINPDDITAEIRPYCQIAQTVRYRVLYRDGQYVKTNEVLSNVYKNVFVYDHIPDGEEDYVLNDPDATTTTGEKVHAGFEYSEDGTSEVEIYFCEVQEFEDITDVYLAVYRREYDGSFTKIESDIDGETNATVVDPHPSLDYARYRIVATSKDTGAISFYDLPLYPVDCKSVIIQWDEAWTNFEVRDDGEVTEPSWSGSMLKLPYNIDVSDNTRIDVEHVEYIGRSHPISYYGTQVGESSTWNVTIDKSDKETIYALRRLSKWMGDVYVREPSGLGYWATISVSFSQKHCEKAVPVTLNITRVEGGV